MMKKLVMVILFALLILPGLSFAQEDKPGEESITKIEDVVVTATRTEKSKSEVFADVDILTDKDIQASTANNVDDIIRRLGGVDIRRPSAMGITSPLSINIRGVGGTKRVLFMMDGVPLNSALTGMVQPNQIQLQSVKRIEVVKGPFSSLYGSNAMGGVINIISKKREKDGIDFIPKAKIGNFGFREAGESLLGRAGNFSYSLDSSFRTMDNHYCRDKQVDYSFNRRTGGFDKSYTDVSNNSEYKDKRVFTRLGYDFSGDTSVTFTGSFTKADTEMGQTHFLSVPRNIDTEKTLYFLNVEGKTLIKDRVEFNMRVYTNYDKSLSDAEHIIDNPGMGRPFFFKYGERKYWGRDVGAQVNASMPIGNVNYLTAGIDSNFKSGYWKNSEEDGTVIDHVMDESLNNQAIYLQNETELFSCFTATLGIRYDINSESENAFSPKLGLLYKLNDRISFRSSVGRAFRTPNLNELYTPTWMMVPGIPFVSNSDLDPEIVWSYDIGTSIRLTDTIDFNLTGFHSQGKDLISNPITNGIMHYENLDEVDTDGVEVGLDGKILPWLSAYVNYTYTHSVDEDNGRLDNMPLHQANGGIQSVYNIGSNNCITASLDARYNGSMFFKDRMTKEKIDIDSYLVLDFNLRLELFDRVGIQGSVTNIADEDYEIHGSNLGPERCFWLGFDYRF